MEQLYDHEFDPDGPEPQSQQHEEIETIGSTTPTTTTPSSENQAWCKYCQKVKYKATSTYGTANAKKHTLVCPDYLASSPYLILIKKCFVPKVRHVTRNTILRYCLLEHERLKSFLRECLSELNSRVCFTCDCWSACTSRGFLTLTAHFVDNNWNLKSCILNFRYFPPPHRGMGLRD
ncbi:Zinc finger BED domain-containing protein RICESLEEPER 2 [Bienertia sinuspersici]